MPKHDFCCLAKCSQRPVLYNAVLLLRASITIIPYSRFQYGCPRRDVHKMRSPPIIFKASARGIVYSFQLAMTTPRMNLTGCGTALRRASIKYERVIYVFHIVSQTFKFLNVSIKDTLDSRRQIVFRFNFDLITKYCPWFSSIHVSSMYR